MGSLSHWEWQRRGQGCRDRQGGSRASLWVCLSVLEPGAWRGHGCLHTDPSPHWDPASRPTGAWDRAGPWARGGQCRLEKWQSSWQQAGGRRGRCPFGDRGAVEQVQADQYIPEDDIHREVDTIERQLDALEHRGVQLEEKLRGGMNGAGSWERLAGGTQGWREPPSLGGVGTAASPGLSAHLASREP